MMKWNRIGRETRGNGESTTFYEEESGWFRIESRKRAIPHANREGYWMHTSYFLIDENGNEKEFYRLQDAKEAAESK